MRKTFNVKLKLYIFLSMQQEKNMHRDQSMSDVKFIRMYDVIWIEGTLVFVPWWKTFYLMHMQKRDKTSPKDKLRED